MPAKEGVCVGVGVGVFFKLKIPDLKNSQKAAADV